MWAYIGVLECGSLKLVRKSWFANYVQSVLIIKRLLFHFLKNLESQQKTFPTFVQSQSTVVAVSVLVAGTLAESVHLSWLQV